jgi:hypothetical protein
MCDQCEDHADKSLIVHCAGCASSELWTVEHFLTLAMDHALAVPLECSQV